jgi:hypothetical protein
MRKVRYLIRSRARRRRTGLPTPGEKTLIRIGRMQIGVGIVALVVAGFGVTIAYFGLEARIKVTEDIGRETEKVVKDIRYDVAEAKEPLIRGYKGTILAAAPEKLRIIEPKNGARVEYRVGVKGYTIYLNTSHYIIVIPAATPDEWIVQSSPVIIRADGTLSGGAEFGKVGKGIGEEFQIMLVATPERLERGKLGYIPEVARWSQPVKVKRTY